MGLTTGNSVVLTGLAIELDIANPKSYAVFGGAKGYSLGGYSGASVNTADKITYSNDTSAAQTTANLSTSRYGPGGMSEGNTKGYSIGGYSTNYVNTADKTFYSSDVTTASTSSNISYNSYAPACLSNYVNKGYACGGDTGSGNPTNKIDFLYFSNDVTVSQTSTTLSSSREYCGTVSLPNVKGYIAGGATANNTFSTTTDKITFSSDVLSAQTSANLSAAKFATSGISECSTKGYFGGGYTTVSANPGSSTDKIVFSTDTTSAQTTANLSGIRAYCSGVSQGSSKGYYLGGWTTWSSTAVATGDKLTFSTDTTAAQTSANLSSARGAGASLDNIYSQTISDIAGGVNNATINNFTTYSRDNGGCLVFSGSVDYPNTATVAANSSYAFGTGDFTYEVWFNAASFASGNNYILDLGTNAGVLRSDGVKLIYYNSTAGTGSNLYTKGPAIYPGNWYNCVITRLSGTTYIYLNGNLTTSGSDTHNYSAPAVTIGNYGAGGKYGWNGKIALFRLYSGKGLSATEVLQNYNATKNRFLVPSPVIDSSLVLNLDASNRLSFARYGGSKAYFSGGSYSASNVATDKLTYSNDTTVAQTSANLPSNHGYGTPLSDGYSKGYVCGDYPTTVTTDKVTYSTETAAAATTANLSQGRGFGTGLSDYRTKGFVLGGYNNYANADKIAYATDTSNAVSSAQLGTAKFNGAQRLYDGSANGYYLGGASGSDVVQSAIQKVVYSTEVTSTIQNTISVARHLGGGNANFGFSGYICGGYTGAPTYYAVNADKFIFSNEFSSALASANLTVGRYGVGAAADGVSKGFVIGGYSTGSVTTADKITYSTETTTAQASANLTGSRYMPCGLEEIYNVSSTSWFDITTNGNTGTLTNGPTYSLTNPSIIFDGSDDKVIVSNNTSINLQSFSVESWFLTGVANKRILVKESSGGVTNYSMQIDASGYLNAGVYDGTNNPSFSNNSKIVTDSFWHHAVLTRSNTASRGLSIYLDGVLQQNNDSTVGNTITNSDVLTLGNRTFSSSAFSGNLSLVRIYNRALNSLEVLQNYNFYLNKLAFAAVGTSKDFPAPSGVAIKSVNPYAQTGYYWLSVGGTTSQYWIDMDYDGGGWVLVINNNINTNGMTNLTYANATSYNVNTRNNFGSDYTPANFNCFVGLPAWKAIADATAGSNTVVMFVATAYRTLGNIANHTKRARFTWTGWSATYAWQGAASYTNEVGSTTAGLWSYHITNGYNLTTYDQDQDSYGSNCSTLYNNNPWWYGACWDGNFLAGGAGYQDAPYWSGSGGDYHNYGAIYVR